MAFQLKRLFNRSSLAFYGGVLLLVIMLIGIAGPLLGLQDPTHISLADRNKPPGWQDVQGNKHYLGTDHLGRDLLSRIIYGLRISLVVGFSGMVIGAILGGGSGIFSGYSGGKIDALIMRIVDIQMSFPYVLLAILLSVLWGGGLIQIIIIVGIRGWADYARIIRSSVLSIRVQPFILAAHAIGATTPRILTKHILPQIVAPAIIIGTFQVGNIIVLESTLSFLGIGLAPPIPSLGVILSDGRSYVADAWWAVVFPGIVLTLVILSINLLGDGLRDILDPRLRM